MLLSYSSKVRNVSQTEVQGIKYHALYLKKRITTHCPILWEMEFPELVLEFTGFLGRPVAGVVYTPQPK